MKLYECTSPFNYQSLTMSLKFAQRVVYTEDEVLPVIKNHEGNFRDAGELPDFAVPLSLEEVAGYCSRWIEFGVVSTSWALRSEGEIARRVLEELWNSIILFPNAPAPPVVDKKDLDRPRFSDLSAVIILKIIRDWANRATQSTISTKKAGNVPPSGPAKGYPAKLPGE